MAKKILIVEDEEIMINLLQKKLEKEGYEVIVTKDGED
jgi:CheY-like chemotaxis protein